MIEADSKRSTALPPGPFKSTAAGIFEFGLTATNPLVN